MWCFKWLNKPLSHAQWNISHFNKIISEQQLKFISKLLFKLSSPFIKYFIWHKIIYFISEERGLLLFLKLLEQQPGRFIKEKKKRDFTSSPQNFWILTISFCVKPDFDKRVEQQVLLSNPWQISRKAIEGNVKATH